MEEKKEVALSAGLSWFEVQHPLAFGIGASDASDAPRQCYYFISDSIEAASKYVTENLGGGTLKELKELPRTLAGIEDEVQPWIVKKFDRDHQIIVLCTLYDANFNRGYLKCAAQTGIEDFKTCMAEASNSNNSNMNMFCCYPWQKKHLKIITLAYLEELRVLEQDVIERTTLSKEYDKLLEFYQPIYSKLGVLKSSISIASNGAAATESSLEEMKKLQEEMNVGYFKIEELNDKIQILDKKISKHRPTRAW